MKKQNKNQSFLHHPFCNHPNRPIKGCSCNEMWKKYGNLLVDEIMKTYFPDVIERK